MMFRGLRATARSEKRGVRRGKISIVVRTFWSSKLAQYRRSLVVPMTS